MKKLSALITVISMLCSGAVSASASGNTSTNIPSGMIIKDSVYCKIDFEDSALGCVSGNNADVSAADAHSVGGSNAVKAENLTGDLCGIKIDVRASEIGESLKIGETYWVSCKIYSENAGNAEIALNKANGSHGYFAQNVQIPEKEWVLSSGKLDLTKNGLYVYVNLDRGMGTVYIDDIEIAKVMSAPGPKIIGGDIADGASDVSNKAKSYYFTADKEIDGAYLTSDYITISGDAHITDISAGADGKSFIAEIGGLRKDALYTLNFTLFGTDGTSAESSISFSTVSGGAKELMRDGGAENSTGAGGFAKWPQATSIEVSAEEKYDGDKSFKMTIPNDAAENYVLGIYDITWSAGKSYYLEFYAKKQTGCTKTVKMQAYGMPLKDVTQSMACGSVNTVLSDTEWTKCSVIIDIPADITVDSAKLYIRPNTGDVSGGETVIYVDNISLLELPDFVFKSQTVKNGDDGINPKLDKIVLTFGAELDASSISDSKFKLTGGAKIVGITAEDDEICLEISGAEKRKEYTLEILSIEDVYSRKFSDTISFKTAGDYYVDEVVCNESETKASASARIANYAGKNLSAAMIVCAYDAEAVLTGAAIAKTEIADGDSAVLACDVSIGTEYKIIIVDWDTLRVIYE